MSILKKSNTQIDNSHQISLPATQLKPTYSFVLTSNFNNFNSNLIPNKEKLEKIRLKITENYLILQKEQTKGEDALINLTKELNLKDLSNGNEASTNFQHLQFANTIVNYENIEEIRTVKLKRHSIYGLGLCVKGGKEHGLPLLISNMFKNQPADQCGQLKVGDAILKVNNIDITQLTHEQAVNVLKSTSAPSSNWNGITKRNSANIDNKMDYDVILTVKNYSSILEKFRVSATQSLQNITQQLTENNKQDHLSKNETKIDGEPGWIDLISIPLELAYVTQYVPGTDRMRDLAFEVYSKTGISSGILLCDSVQKKNDLIQKINQNIQLCNASYISSYNQYLLPSNQITYISWVNERIHSEQNWSCWNRVLLVIKSTECLMYDNCEVPNSKGDFNKCKRTYKVYESLFKIIKLHEQLDERNYCFVLHNCDGTAHYMNVESSEHLVQLEKHWQRTLYTSIYSLGSKSFTCIYDNKVCMLYIDIHKGFILIDNEKNETLWSYQFSQLKTSSDDNVSKVKFFFQDPLIKRIEVKHLDCSELYCLLYVIHSFLTAKLTSVNINSIK